MRTLIESRIWFRKPDAPKGLVTALEDLCTLANPEWENRRRRGIWTGKTPRTLKYYTHSKEWMTIPRGMMLDFMKECRARGVEPQYESRVTHVESELVPERDLGVTLRDYQSEALRDMVSRKQGYVVLPAGSGKTILGAAALCCVNQPGMVIVGAKDLIPQWVSALKKMFEPKIRILQGGGRKDWSPIRQGEIVIAMVNTLNLNAKKRGKLMKSVGALVVDEGHHSSARTWYNSVNAISARYRWAVTATPKRADGLEVVLGLLFGPVLHRKTLDELVDAGYLRRPLVLKCSSGLEAKEEHYEWIATCPGCGHSGELEYEKVSAGNVKEDCPMDGCTGVVTDEHIAKGQYKNAQGVTAIANSDGAMEPLIPIIRQAYESGRSTLMLMPRVEAARAMVEVLRNAAVPCAAVYSKAPQREQRIKQLKDGSLPVLVATSLADEGLDVPALDLLVQCIQEKNERGTIQRSGRVMRPDGMDPPIVIEWVHGGAHEWQWGHRERTYKREIGVTPIVATLEEAEEVVRRCGTDGMTFESHSKKRRTA